jgi:uracil-DNA glycosylase
LHAQLFNQLHPEWQVVLADHKDLVASIEAQLDPELVAPPMYRIFRALSFPISATKVVIFGQDPYPTAGHAHGLAFSVEQQINPLPPTLRNIFDELATDTGAIKRTNADLSDWFEQGVLLLNRILTTEIGSSMAHATLGWQTVTNSVAEQLGKHDVVAVFWGKSAGELRGYFRKEMCIESVHPSPLSSYRGFFGSKPFSRTNEILVRHNLAPIKW